MEEAKPTITIPEKDGSVGPSAFEQKAAEKFKNIDTLIYAIVVSLIIAAISALISVGAIIIDQLHFNNQTYREFSDSKNVYSELVERMDKVENRLNTQEQLIIEQQNQILELLNKK